MPAEVEVTTAEVIVAPGAEEVVEARLRNLGGVTETFSATVVGAGQGWTFVDPPLVTLFPGAEQTLRITFRPPRAAAVTAGETTMGLRIVPHGDPDDTTTADVVVRLLSFDERRLSFLQPVARARARANYDLVVENDGNTRATYRLSLVDSSHRLGARFDPPSVSVEPGGREVVRVRIAARQQRLGGQPQPHMFTVKAAEDGHPSVQASATFLQTALLPERLGRWIIGLALVIGLGVLAWFALLKPAVEDTAEEAARNAVAAAAPTTVATNDTSVTATTSVQNPEQPVVGEGDPWDEQWTVDAPQGEVTLSDPVTVDEGTVVRLTDVFWSNEAQDTGTISLLRDGQVVMKFALGINRNYAQAFRNGVQIPPGGNLAVQLDCVAPGDQTSTSCEVSFTLFGVELPAES